MQLEPQLSALGEATPPLDKVLSWLGVQREAIPLTVHSSVTAPLQDLLKTLADTLILLSQE